MAINNTPVPDARLNMKIRSLFLDHLAQTANVAASARAAGVSSNAVYAERRRTPAFRDAWALALAEGYARSTGKPGVVLVTSGPGATNAVTGITDALMDSIPIIVLTGQVPTFMIGTDGFQEADTIGITRHCTKHNYLVKDPADLAATRALIEAGALSLDGLITHRRPGTAAAEAYQTAFEDADCLKMILDWSDAA